MAKSERSGGFFGWLLWTTAVFCGGYLAGSYGPMPREALAHIGVHVRPSESHDSPGIRGDAPPPVLPEEPDSPARSLRELLASVAAHVGALNTRIDQQEASLKESETSAKILLSRGEPEESELVQRLRREQDRLRENLATLDGSLDEALALEGELQRVLDATADVDAVTVDGEDILVEARAVLARLDLLGLAPTASGN